jgi:hypothetical protein
VLSAPETGTLELIATGIGLTGLAAIARRRNRRLIAHDDLTRAH